METREQKVLPYYDLVFKKTFTSPESHPIALGLLRDIAEYDPLKILTINELIIESPYQFKRSNELEKDVEGAYLSTEVDFACRDNDGVRFSVEVQVKKEKYFEERNHYNASVRYGQLYGNVEIGESKYKNLKPVIAVSLLYQNFYDDEYPVRFLRPYDERIGAYANDKNLGLQIVIELSKDPKDLPINLQHWFYYFKNGTVKEEAPRYVEEAAKLTELSLYTKEEREHLERLDRMIQKRLSEDEYIRDEVTVEVTERVTAEVTERVTAEVTVDVSHQKDLMFARKLLEDGVSIEKIVAYTGLSKEEIMLLK